MGHELICTWLGLPEEAWPPDHYQLLGLSADELDSTRIEEEVHRRLEIVRRYQILHPDLVTEAMNRLAQAYLCLTDPQTRRCYDANQRGGGSSASLPMDLPRPGSRPMPPPPPAVGPRPSALPVRVPARPVPAVPAVPSAVPVLSAEAARPQAPSVSPAVLSPAPAESAPGGVWEVPATAVPVGEVGNQENPVAVPVAVLLPEIPLLTGEDASPPPPPEPVRIDPIVEAAQTSAPARRGLGSRRALYHRLAVTRRLQRSWNALARYLADSGRRLTKPQEAVELIQRLKAVQEALIDFPPLLGKAGQPGYTVVALARQAAPVPIFQTLTPGQRESLAQHWRSGLQLLEAHREFLRREIAALRKKTIVGRLYRVVSRTLTDQPGVLLLLVALIALNVAIWRQYISLDWFKPTPPSPTEQAPAVENR